MRRIKIKTSSTVKGDLIFPDEFIKTRVVQSDIDAHLNLRRISLLSRKRINGKIRDIGFSSFIHRPGIKQQTKEKHDVSETGSVSVLR
jgi:hypothetical protein